MGAGYSADRRHLDFRIRSPAEDGDTIHCVESATSVTDCGGEIGELLGFPGLSFQLDGACRSPELMQSAGQVSIAVRKLALAAKPTETAFSRLLVAENAEFGRIGELRIPKGKQRPCAIAQASSGVGCCLITANRAWLGARHCRGRRTKVPETSEPRRDCVSNLNNANPAERNHPRRPMVSIHVPPLAASKRLYLASSLPVSTEALRDR